MYDKNELSSAKMIITIVSIYLRSVFHKKAELKHFGQPRLPVNILPVFN